MAVTIRELAEAAGVSIATVSRVLTNSGHPVADDTRQRVLDVAEQLGYRPNFAARGLRTERSATVGIIADSISSPFTPIIIRGIQDELKPAGYTCVIINAYWDAAAEQEAIHDLIGRAIDGVIFVESWHRTANETLDLANKPYVFVHRQFAATHQHSVTPDEVYGAELAVNHLLSLGHRRIGFINGPSHYYASADRLRGYRAALAAAGIAFDPALVADGDWSAPSGLQAARQLLAARRRPTAIFAGNDLMAVGAIYACSDAGLQVPADIALVGYDDREIAAIFRPALTTVTLPCYEMGQASAQMLLELLRSQAEAIEEVRIRGRLIVRESCGVQPSRQGSCRGQPG